MRSWESPEEPEGFGGQRAVRRHLATEWLDRQEPDLAIRHGSLLLDIIDARIDAEEFDDAIEVLKFSWMMKHRYGDPIQRFDQEDYQAKVQAQAIYRGLEPRDGPTGVSTFDRLYALEDSLVASADSSDDFTRLLVVLDGAREAAVAIRDRTDPDSMVA